MNNTIDFNTAKTIGTMSKKICNCRYECIHSICIIYTFFP